MSKINAKFASSGSLNQFPGCHSHWEKDRMAVVAVTSEDMKCFDSQV